jgi:hypothetical protein
MASNYSPSSFIAVAAQPGALAPVTILQESRHVNWEEEQDEFGGTGNYSSTMESHPFVLNDGGLLQISTSGDTNTTAWLLCSLRGAVAGASGGGGNFSLTFTAPGPGDYWVWVWREDDTGSGDYDLTVDFTPREQILPLPGTVLAKPQALPATAANTGGFTANWNGVPGVARFRLDVATDDLFSAASILPAWNNVDVSNTLSFIVTGLTSGLSYFYRVRAINTVGLPSPSSEPMAAAPLGAPPPPPNLGVATAITTGGFTAHWTAIPGVAGYVIDLSQELTFATLVGGWSGAGAGGPTATSKTVTGLAGGTTYYYRVRAFNAIGVGAYSLPRTLTTLPTSAGPSAGVNPGTGLAVDYFSDLTLSQLMDTGTVSQIADYDDNGDSEEQSSRRYTGFVRPYNTGPLTFVLNADDGARLWINHQLLIDTWTQGGGQMSAPVSLSAGQLYALKLEFFQNGGERRVELLWQDGGQVSEVIPASRLYPPGTPPNLPVIGGLNTAGGTFGVAFSAQLMASGSPTSYTVTGPLPTGLVFNPRTGAITGTPTQTGTFRLTVQATNALGASAPAPLTLTIAKATPVLTVKNESVENQAFLPITPAMIPVNAVAPAAGLPAPNGTIRYTAYRVDIATQTFDPLRPSFPAVPNSFYYGIDQNYGKLSVTATYNGDANYLPATKTVIFENRDTAPPVFTEGTGLTPLLVAPKSASVRWNPATDPRGVTYDVSLDNGASVFASGLTKPETVLPNLTADSIYQVVVRATDSRNNSTMWSPPLTVITPSAASTASTGSTWRDLNGDGLADEIIPNEVTPNSSTRFNYFALPEQDRTLTFAEWVLDFIYVSGYSYSLPGGDFYTTASPTNGYLVGLDSFMPIWSEEIQTVTLAQVMPVFQFVAEPGYAYSVNRELTRSDGAKLYPRIFVPTLWEDLGSVATVHEWSPGGPWLEQSYDAFPHVLVRYSQPIGSISLAGQFAAVTVGTTRGLGGILSVPFPASGNVVISLKDLANQVLKAGPKVVWEVWDRINQIRVGTSTVGDLLDIGINTSGEFQVGLKLDDSTQVWFNVSVQPPPAPKLAVDANRDGTITFDAADATSASAPYRFWLNDDDDVKFSSAFWSDRDPEYYPARRPDSGDRVINSPRDCEDLSRLWLDLSGLAASIKSTSSDLYIGLKWKTTGGTAPAIRLFRSADPTGGLGHIKDVMVARIQADKVNSRRYDFCLVHADYADLSLDPIETNPEIDQVASGADSRPADFIFTKGAFGEVTESQPMARLLFEAVREGKGELVLVVVRKTSSNSWEKVFEGGSVWLQLENIRRMYVRVHATPAEPNFLLPWQVSSPPPSPYEESSVIAEDKALRILDTQLSYAAGDSTEALAAHPFSPVPGEQAKCVVFVHGIDLNVPTQQGYAQSFFKRLWWEGYRGRFVAFRWSTPLADGIFNSPFGWGQEGKSVYNSGEYRAFKGGTSLRKFVSDLRSSTNPFYVGAEAVIGLAAHSQGNIAAGEALRQGMQVNSYVAMEAAVPLSCYYSSSETLPAFPRFSNAETQSRTTASHGGASPRYPGYFASLGSSAKASYHNEDDFWLVGGTAAAGLFETNWIANNAKYKPDLAGTLNNYRFNFINGPYFEASARTLRGVLDAHESMAFVCRSMSLALGAVAPAPMFGSQVNLKTQYQFGLGRPDHSGQFQRDIQFMYGNENGIPWAEPLYVQLMRHLLVGP